MTTTSRVFAALAAMAFLSLVVMPLAGCATQGPVVDLYGKDGGKYQRDLAECRSLASRSGGLEKTGMDAVVGGLLGAAAGVVIGAATGDPASGAIIGTAVGGSAGLLHGGYQAYSEPDQIVKGCLKGRGYRVLN